MTQRFKEQKTNLLERGASSFRRTLIKRNPDNQGILEQLKIFYGA